MTREVHSYYPDHGPRELQVWELIGGTWVQHPPGTESDWPITSYTYHSWPHPLPEHPLGKDLPPRLGWGQTIEDNLAHRRGTP